MQVRTMLLRKQSKISHISQSSQSPFQTRRKAIKANHSKQKQPLEIYNQQITETKANIQSTIHKINEHITTDINQKQKLFMMEYEHRLVSAQQELNRLRLVTNDQMIKIKIKQRKQELQNRKKSLIQTNMYFNQKCQGLKNVLIKLADTKIYLTKQLLFLEGRNQGKQIQRILSNYQNKSLKHDKSLSSIKKQKSIEDQLSDHSKSKSKQKKKNKKKATIQMSHNTQRVNTQQAAENSNLYSYSNRAKLPVIYRSYLNKSIPVVNSQHNLQTEKQKKQNKIDVKYSSHNFQKHLNLSNVNMDRKKVNKSLGLLEKSIQKQFMPQIKQKKATHELAKKLFSSDKKRHIQQKLNNFSEYIIKDRKFSVLQKSELSRMKTKTKDNLNFTQIFKYIEKTPIEKIFLKCLEEYAQVKANKCKKANSHNEQKLKACDKQSGAQISISNLQSSATDFDKRLIMDIFFQKQEVKRLIYEMMFTTDAKNKESPSEIIKNSYNF